MKSDCSRSWHTYWAKWPLIFYWGGGDRQSSWVCVATNKLNGRSGLRDSSPPPKCIQSLCLRVEQDRNKSFSPAQPCQLLHPPIRMWFTCIGSIAFGAMPIKVVWMLRCCEMSFPSPSSCSRIQIPTEGKKKNPLPPRILPRCTSNVTLRYPTWEKCFFF